MWDFHFGFGPMCAAFISCMAMLIFFELRKTNRHLQDILSKLEK